jgi:L-ascorbate metabolism protein UlaG (beta-lactamase superfamily)
MDIYWGGQSLFRIKGKNATLVIDPFDPETVGLKLPKDLASDIVLKTHDHPDHNNIKAIPGEPILVSGPGEYDIKGVAITGVYAPHDDKNGAERGKNTAYNLNMEGLNIVHLGDLGVPLTEEQVQEIGACDILMIPVGGVYTIDAKTATEVVSQLEPRIILPMHYGGLPGFKIPLEPVENFLKEMGVESVEPQPKLTITKDKLPDEPQVVILNKT